MIGASVAIALEALWSNKLRSLLTALGIFIGVAAVIATLTLTQGAGAFITGNIASLGTNVITIIPGSTQTRGLSVARVPLNPSHHRMLLPSNIYDMSQE